MASVATGTSRSGTVVLDRWSARRVQPVVLLYVAVVFAAFMALSFFVFHSLAAVKALVIAAAGAIVATTPAVLERIEYQLTDLGLDKRALRTGNGGAFTDVFRWNDLSHVVPLRHGFKYFKKLDETRPVQRFWKTQVSDRYSGEVHVAKGDVDRVLEILERKGIPSR